MKYEYGMRLARTIQSTRRKPATMSLFPHKSHMDCPGTKPILHAEIPAPNPLNHNNSEPIAEITKFQHYDNITSEHLKAESGCTLTEIQLFKEHRRETYLVLTGACERGICTI